VFPLLRYFFFASLATVVLLALGLGLVFKGERSQLVAIAASLFLFYGIIFLIVRKASEVIHRQYEELERSGDDLRIAATAFEIHLAMVVTDGDGIIVRVNRAFSESYGYSQAEAVGKSLSLLKSGRHEPQFYADIWKDISNLGTWQGEIWNRSKDGDVRPDWLSITAVMAPDGRVTHYVGTLIDITQRLAEEEKVKLLAFYDPLTMLPNRRLLLDRLHHAVSASARSGRHGGLMFIDLDNFKEVNDRLGHDAGDLLLQRTGDRLKEALRQTDTVARWGGDEFIIMLEALDQDLEAAREQLAAIAAKVRQSLAAPYHLHDRECTCTPSIGAILFDGKRASVDELLKKADAAMYQAKFDGRNCVSLAGEDAAG
jgi:diguanylate cyclase (GGDEF)-like protein/PAS domain S-box-containing protein